MNSWPGGKKTPISQVEHDKYNQCNYPGTLQICCICDAPTGRCEEDALLLDIGLQRAETRIVCETCFDLSQPKGV
jgi:hypothetical protein